MDFSGPFSITLYNFKLFALCPTATDPFGLPLFVVSLLQDINLNSHVSFYDYVHPLCHEHEGTMLTVLTLFEWFQFA